MRALLAPLFAALLASCSPSGNDVTSSSPAQPTASWRHSRSGMLANLGSPRHSANDSIALPRAAVEVEGKFTYTKVSKDLEDEFVALELFKGNDWVKLGKALTDSDGRARFTVPAAQLPASGMVRYRFVVEADRTDAEALIWVLPRGTKVALFDIDGTLTIADSELTKKTLFNSDIDARKGARALVAFRAEQGYLPLYLSGRPYLYNSMTREWLTGLAFPLGPVITSDHLSQALPTESSVGTFKRTKLTSLLNDAGLAIEAAYGNADTDVCAFAKAGIGPKKIFIIGSEMTACPGHDPHVGIDSFDAHLQALTSD